jgi:vacuolar-type H+-ATPase subunit C/Vma6
MVDAVSEVFLEMVESENVAVDEAAVERFLTRRLARSLGDQRESQTLYHWAEIVEIDEQELLIIGRCF